MILGERDFQGWCSKLLRLFTSFPCPAPPQGTRHWPPSPWGPPLDLCLGARHEPRPPLRGSPLPTLPLAVTAQVWMRLAPGLGAPHGRRWGPTTIRGLPHALQSPAGPSDRHLARGPLWQGTAVALCPQQAGGGLSHPDASALPLASRSFMRSILGRFSCLLGAQTDSECTRSAVSRRRAGRPIRLPPSTATCPSLCSCCP